MNRNYSYVSSARGGGKIADTWNRIRGNNILRGIFTILIIALVIGIVYGLYTLTQKKIKEDLELTCRAAPKGCVLHSQASPLQKAVTYGHPKGGRLPHSKNATDYSINIWLYSPSANWASSNNATWRHILSGITDFSTSQPSVWLHPNTNTLLIRWNTVPRILPTTQGCNDQSVGCNLTSVGNIRTLPSKVQQICSPVCKNSNTGTTKPGFNWETYQPTKELNPGSGPTGCKLPPGSRDCCPSNIYTGGCGPKVKPDTPLTIIAQQCVPNIPLDRWYLLSIATRSNSADVYIDGKLVTTVVFGTSIGESPQHIKIGGTTASTGASGGSWSQLRYYDTAITPFDVLKVYSWGPYPFDLSKSETDWKAKYEKITGSISVSASYTNPQTQDTGFQGY